MRICIPTETDEGNDACVHAHFGSAPVFTIYDTHSNELEYLKNTDHQHIHGMCQPLAALEGRSVDAVICTGMGARAVQRLNNGGVKTYRARGKTVQEVLRRHQEQALEEITVHNACMDHDCHQA
jgi:predicted Fe-Mo cluster-binding NifX family protein